MSLILPMLGNAGGLVGPLTDPLDLIRAGDTAVYYDPTDSANYTLDGGDSRVSTLLDLAPDGIDLARAGTDGPAVSTVNGVPQLDFAFTTQKILRVSNNAALQDFNRQITVCCIATPGSQTDVGNAFWAPNITIADLRSTGSNPEVPFSIGKGDSKPWLGWYDGASAGGNSFITNGGSTLSSGTTYVMTFIGDDASGTIYLDGSLDDSGTDTTATGSRVVDATNHFSFGGRTLDSSAISDPWDGYIGPFFAINRVLSAADQERLEDYFLSLIS